MKNKIIKTILPSITGVLIVLVFLILYTIIFHKEGISHYNDNGFFKYFVPAATIIAILIQFILVLPFWKRFKIQKKIWGLTLFRFTGILCIISGPAFGLVFWETNLGINELIKVSLTGIIAFTVYWASNLLTLRWLDRNNVK